MSISLRKRSPRRGFTLLELMIVLVLMVSLLAIAWPNLQRPLRRTTLNEAAQKLREAIDEGRYEAITTGKPIFVQIHQGDHEVRTGSFANFADEELDGSSGVGSLNSSVDHTAMDSSAQNQPSFGTDSHSQSNTLKTWRLPDSVIITEVNWTSDSVEDEESDDLTSGEDDSQLGNAKSSRSSSETEDVVRGHMVSAPDADSLLSGTAQADWWLPISATGQSRDASIVLYDTSINETMTVTYASKTGALEIVR